MKNKLVFSLTTLVFAALLITACSKLPQAEIDQANLAIDSARIAGADVYVPEDFLNLQDSLKAVMEDVEAQKSKLFKNYGSAQEKLVQVAQLAKEVEAKAEVRKVEVKNEVDTLLTEMATLIEENKQLIAKAPRGKEGASALEAMKNEIATIETSVAEATALRDSGDLMAALDKVKAAKDQATALNTELKDAIAKYKGRK